MKKGSAWGVYACIGFLAFMGVFSQISKVLSEWMRPAVMLVNTKEGVVRTEQFQKVEYDGNLSSLQREGADILLYDENGGVHADAAELEEGMPYLAKWVSEEEKSAFTLPKAELYGSRPSGIYVLSSGLVSSRTVVTKEEGDLIFAVESGREHVIVAASKPIQENQRVRINKVTKLTQDGEVVWIPRETVELDCEYPLWMLALMLPDGCEIEGSDTERGSVIRKVTIPVSEGSSFVELDALLMHKKEIIGLHDSIQEYRFLEQEKWLALSDACMAFFLSMLGVVACLLLLAKCFIQFEGRMVREIRQLGLAAACRANLEPILTFLLGASVLTTTVFFLLRFAGYQSLEAFSILLPQDRVLDIGHYQKLFQQWKSNRALLTMRYPDGAAARYWSELTGKWQRAGQVSGAGMAVFAIFLAVIILWDNLSGRLRNVTRRLSAPSIW